MRRGVRFQYDTMKLHVSVIIRTNYTSETGVLIHPIYSPDIALYEFNLFLFPSLGGKWFAFEDALKSHFDNLLLSVQLSSALTEF